MKNYKESWENTSDLIQDLKNLPPGLGKCYVTVHKDEEHCHFLLLPSPKAHPMIIAGIHTYLAVSVHW